MPGKILGNELPDDAFELLNKGTTVVVATVDEDGYPHTAPIGCVGAPDKKTLRLGIGRSKETYRNIKRNGKVMVCIMDRDNIAISVKGIAETVKEIQLTSSWNMPITDIKIEQVKSDATSLGIVTHGIGIELTEQGRKVFTPEVRRKITESKMSLQA